MLRDNHTQIQSSAARRSWGPSRRSGLRRGGSEDPWLCVPDFGQVCHFSDVTALYALIGRSRQFWDVRKIESAYTRPGEGPLWVTSRHSNPTFTDGSFGAVSGRQDGNSWGHLDRVSIALVRTAAFTDSGRSEYLEACEIKVSKRPVAVIHHHSPIQLRVRRRARNVAVENRPRKVRVPTQPSHWGRKRSVHGSVSSLPPIR